MAWQIVDDFDDTTRGGAVCNIYGTIKADGDVGVFRADLIEGEGFFDVSQMAVEEAATMLGWVPPERVTRMQQQIDQTEAASSELRRKLDTAMKLRELLEEAKGLFKPIGRTAKAAKGKSDG